MRAHYPEYIRWDLTESVMQPSDCPPFRVTAARVWVHTFELVACCQKPKGQLAAGR